MLLGERIGVLQGADVIGAVAALVGHLGELDPGLGGDMAVHGGAQDLGGGLAHAPAG